MTGAVGWPSRREVESWWLAILDGTASREEIHDRTVPWVEGKLAVGPSHDIPVGMAVQYLHGFTLVRDPDAPHGVRHGGPGEYLKSLDEVRMDLEYWRAQCAAHDRDPAAWRERRLAIARAFARRGG